MRITAKEVAEYLGVKYVIASGLMTILVDKGIAKHVDNIKHSSGKGKPTRVFEVESEVTLQIFEGMTATQEKKCDVAVVEDLDDSEIVTNDHSCDEDDDYEDGVDAHDHPMNYDEERMNNTCHDDYDEERMNNTCHDDYDEERMNNTCRDF